MQNITQAVIFAGGRGERLRPLTDDRPKPMVGVGGKPFLEYLIDMLCENGIKEVVVCSGYKHEKIAEHFGDGSRFGVSIRYSVGDVTDETGTRLRNAAHLLRDEFLLLYSDNYWPMNLEKMLAVYRSHGTLGMQTVYNNKDHGSEYGRDNNVRVEENGLVSHYGPRSSDPKLNGTEMGFFLMQKQVLEHLPKENVSFQASVLPELIKRNQLAAYRSDHPYYYITSPAHIPVVEEFLRPKKVIFLDRDGVINRQLPEDYVKRWEEFKFAPGATEAIRQLTKSGYDIYVVTNQRGIARGLMTEADLAGIHAKMKEELHKAGGKIRAIYYCPHGKDHGCECRKPKPGMFFCAARDHHINLTKAVFVGDSESDRGAGDATGVKTIILEKEKGQTLLDVVRPLII